MTFITEPLSRNQLRDLALKIRQIIDFESVPRFPVISFLENVMPILFPNFFLEIVPVSELYENIHGETDVKNKCIRIREDIYEGALYGNGYNIGELFHWRL